MKIAKKYHAINARLIDHDDEGIHVKLDIEADGIGDQYHSMDELYDHRRALNAALFNYWARQREDLELYFGEELPIPKVMKSTLHNDGSMFEGYFIVMAVTMWGQISYHYAMEYWEDFRIPIVECTPPWDGHTSKIVMERLMKIGGK